MNESAKLLDNAKVVLIRSKTLPQNPSLTRRMLPAGHPMFLDHVPAYPTQSISSPKPQGHCSSCYCCGQASSPPPSLPGPLLACQANRACTLGASPQVLAYLPEGLQALEVVVGGRLLMVGPIMGWWGGGGWVGVGGGSLTTMLHVLACPAGWKQYQFYSTVKICSHHMHVFGAVGLCTC